MKERRVLNCIDIIEPYVDELAKPNMPQVQLMGGVGSIGLQNEASIIWVDEDRVIAPNTLYLAQYRNEKKRRNLRDVETMVLSTKPEDINAVESAANSTVGKQLKVETFGFKDIGRTDRLMAKPLGARAIGCVWLSDRYMPGQRAWTFGDNDTQRILFPFSTPIADEALDTWTLEIEGRFELPIPAPGATVLNYLLRSLSGLRFKDAEKVDKMARAIFEKSPDVVDWIVDGPGKSQFEMARVLQTLREPLDEPASLTIGNKLTLSPYTLNELHEHPAFLLRELDSKVRDKVLRIAQIKSQLLHRGESSPIVVDLWQKRIEPLIKFIIHNN